MPLFDLGLHSHLHISVSLIIVPHCLNTESTKPHKTAKWCYSLSFPGRLRIHWTKVRLTTNHCACDERVRPARCLCRCWGSEWGGVETTPQRPKILKPPPNHPPQNKPPTATKRLPLFARTDFQSRILNPSSCFEPEHFSRNLPADRPSATHARRPPRQHTARMGANLPACQACPTKIPPRGQSICCRHLRGRALLTPQPSCSSPTAFSLLYSSPWTPHSRLDVQNEITAISPQSINA